MLPHLLDLKEFITTKIYLTQKIILGKKKLFTFHR
jgi:hypothetical protein